MTNNQTPNSKQIQNLTFNNSLPRGYLAVIAVTRGFVTDILLDKNGQEEFQLGFNGELVDTAKVDWGNHTQTTDTYYFSEGKFTRSLSLTKTVKE